MAERFLALFMFILGGALCYGATQLEDVPFLDPLGHKSFPVFVGIAAIVSGILLLFEKYREKKTLADIEEALTETKSLPFAAAGVLGWMLLMYLFLEMIGFAIIISLFLFGLMAFFNRGKWKTNAAISVTFSLTFYFVFTELIGVPLSRGLLAF